jgi:hypothetical protein
VTLKVVLDWPARIVALGGIETAEPAESVTTESALAGAVRVTLHAAVAPPVMLEGEQDSTEI